MGCFLAFPIQQRQQVSITIIVHLRNAHVKYRCNALVMVWATCSVVSTLCMRTWDGVIVNGGGDPLYALDPLSRLAAKIDIKHVVKHTKCNIKTYQTLKGKTFESSS